MNATAGFCPICWSPVTEEKVEGKTVYSCPKHGIMNFPLDKHPLEKRNAFVRHCDSVGIFDMEAPNYV